MATTSAQSITYYLDQFWMDIADPRIMHLFLLNSRPVVIVAIMTAYILISTVIGPKLMANRRPFQLKTPMLVYNVSMVVINFFYFLVSIWYSNFGLALLDTKYPDRNDTSEQTMFLINIGYIYWWVRLFDFFDTFFFVLRKKNSNISVLHVYHHTAVPTLGWVAARINPMVPGMYLFGMLNCLIHTIMYSYYALSALGPRIKKYLWWKKYLTQMQLGQFAVFGLYTFVMFFVQEGYPMVVFWVFASQPPFFFYMFYDFYRKSYDKSEVKRKTN